MTAMRLTFFFLIFASLSAFAQADLPKTQSSELEEADGGGVKNLSQLKTINHQRILLAGDPYSCTNTKLRLFQRQISKSLKVLYSRINVLRRKGASRCRSRLKIAVKKVPRIKNYISAYDYLMAEALLDQVIADVLICNGARGYSSTINAYNSALTYFYASVSCYYYLYPLPPAPPASAPTPDSAPTPASPSAPIPESSIDPSMAPAPTSGLVTYAPSP